MCVLNFLLHIFTYVLIDFRSFGIKFFSKSSKMIWIYFKLFLVDDVPPSLLLVTEFNERSRNSHLKGKTFCRYFTKKLKQLSTSYLFNSCSVNFSVVNQIFQAFLTTLYFLGNMQSFFLFSQCNSSLSVINILAFCKNRKNFSN